MKRKVELWIDPDEALLEDLRKFERHMQRIQIQHLDWLSMLYDALNDLYIVLGCPHGNHHEGLMQWLAENPEWQEARRGARDCLQEMEAALGFFSFKKYYRQSVSPPEEV